MPEPTIDEMLALLDEIPYGYFGNDVAKLDAIRAILEQHRDAGILNMAVSEFTKIEAIRAFVERVEKRPLSAASDFQDGVYDELAAMESEQKEAL